MQNITFFQACKLDFLNSRVAFKFESQVSLQKYTHTQTQFWSLDSDEYNTTDDA